MCFSLLEFDERKTFSRSKHLFLLSENALSGDKGLITQSSMDSVTLTASLTENLRSVKASGLCVPRFLALLGFYQTWIYKNSAIDQLEGNAGGEQRADAEPELQVRDVQRQQCKRKVVYLSCYFVWKWSDRISSRFWPLSAVLWYQAVFSSTNFQKPLEVFLVQSNILDLC